MICGHCHNHHDRVQEVKDCATAERLSVLAARQESFDDIGPSPRDIVRQSVAIHPDWGVNEHYEYLVNDALVDVTFIEVTEWVLDAWREARFAEVERHHA